MYKSRYAKKQRRRRIKAFIIVFFFVIAVLAVAFFSIYAGSSFADKLFLERAQPTLTIPYENNTDVETKDIVFEKRIYYALQVGAFLENETAVKAADQVMDVGGAGYVLLDQKYRVLACLFLNRDDALRVKDSLSKNSVDSYIYEGILPSVTLTVTAPKKSITDIESANELLFSSISQTASLCEKVDTQKISAEEVREEAKLMALKIDETLEELSKCRALFDENGEIIEGLMGVLENISENLTKICTLTSPDAMALSASMRYNIIDTTVKYKEFVDTLLDGAALI